MLSSHSDRNGFFSRSSHDRCYQSLMVPIFIRSYVSLNKYQRSTFCAARDVPRQQKRARPAATLLDSLVERLLGPVARTLLRTSP
mmetsp:Transcript_19495/g.46214  ORF Transcript_19495/g.46214 Transcript_19495/m.46214 type:complete len:85 (-) Transcript_19495:1041-1295(-)